MSSSTMVINIATLPAGRLPHGDDRYVYIGRPGHGLLGPFGSPIVKGKNCPVCKRFHYGNGATLPCYRRWLAKRIAEDKRFALAVAGLYQKVLVCFCDPLPCHGHVLAEAAASLHLTGRWDG